jgi:hypothetical protein
MVDKRVNRPLSVVAVTLVALIAAPVAAVFLLAFFSAFSADDAVGLTAYGVLVAGATLMTARAFAWRLATSIVVAVSAGLAGVGVVMALNAFGNAVGN